MQLQVKGSNESQFVDHHNIPSLQAFSDTNVILSAYLEALSSLLVMAENDSMSDTVLKSVYQNYTTLRSVRSEIDDDLERADVMLEAIQAKLTI